MNTREPNEQVTNQKPVLDRALGLKEATALNMIDMVGIGPFVVLPLVIKTMNGPDAIWAYVAGALLSVFDGFIWAELGAAMPRAGGSYVFLREAYGAKKWGKFMSFLIIWQTMIQAPLVVASGAIGFAQYLSYILPLTTVTQKMASGALVLTLVALLYRKITAIGKITMLLWIGVIGTMLWFIIGGLSHFTPSLIAFPAEHHWDFSLVFMIALGQATVQTIYTYLGYYNVCHLGGEIRNPEQVIPRSIFLSIAGIAVLYLAMIVGVLGAIPWQEAKESQFIVSTLIEHLYGGTAATFATLLVLWIAFASLFAVLLGYSRIPYAAALDGNFFEVMGRVHPTKHFPHVALLTLGATAFVFSLLFRLSDVIKAILAMRIIVQFIGGGIGVMMLRRRSGAASLPYRMPLYPLPALIAITAWGAIFISTGWTFALGGITVISLGTVVFFIRARARKEWPFAESA
ncbi:MAG TPA: APC family permease [Bacteroidota bacterium]|nr:APC family permease [Bacteroidota bacterium]